MKSRINLVVLLAIGVAIGIVMHKLAFGVIISLFVAIVYNIQARKS